LSRKNSTKWPRSGTSPRVCKVIRLLLAVVTIKLLVLAGIFFMPEFSLTPGVVEAIAQEEAAPAAAPTESAEPAGSPAPANATAPEQAPAAQVEPTPPQPVLLDREALAARQEELNRKEQALKTLEENLEAKLVELKQLEAKLQVMLESAGEVKDQKLRHLVDVYSNMKAKQAAQVLESLDEDIAVRILAGMRGRQAGEILTFVKPEKAAVLSEALTKMQLPFE